MKESKCVVCLADVLPKLKSTTTTFVHKNEEEEIRTSPAWQNSIPIQKPMSNEERENRRTFDTFCSRLHLPFSYKSKYNYSYHDNNNNSFMCRSNARNVTLLPFCQNCELTVIKMSRLQEKLELIETEIQGIVNSITSAILQTSASASQVEIKQEEEDEENADCNFNVIPLNVVKNMRKVIYSRYNPTVNIPPLPLSKTTVNKITSRNTVDTMENEENETDSPGSSHGNLIEDEEEPLLNNTSLQCEDGKKSHFSCDSKAKKIKYQNENDKESIKIKKAGGKEKAPLNCTFCSSSYSCLYSLNRHHLAFHPLIPFPISKINNNNNNSEEKAVQENPTPNKFLYAEKWEFTCDEGTPPTFKCSSCEATRNNKYLMHKHIETEHNRPPRVYCAKCSRYYLNEETLGRHVCRKRNSKQRPITRELPDGSFLYADKWKCDRIRNEAEGGSQYKYKCGACGVEKETIFIMIQHVKSRHIDPKRFLCSECGAGFPNSTFLQEHILRAHNSARNFICEVCGFGAKTQSNLRNHKLAHSGITYKCECGKGFKYKSGLRRHFRESGHVAGSGSVSASEVSKYKCDCCETEVKTSKGLALHGSRCDGKKREMKKNYEYPCKWCGKVYPTKTILRLHVNDTHTTCDQPVSHLLAATTVSKSNDDHTPVENLGQETEINLNQNPQDMKIKTEIENIS